LSVEALRSPFSPIIHSRGGNAYSRVLDFRCLPVWHGVTCRLISAGGKDNAAYALITAYLGESGMYVKSKLAACVLTLLVISGCGSGGHISRYAIVEIPTLPGGFPSNGVGINMRGDVIGTAAGKANNYHLFDEHAFIWQDGRTRDLGALGGDRSRVGGINDLGMVVGSAEFVSEPINQMRPFVYDGAAMHPLPLPAGAWYGDATAINDGIQISGTVTINGYSHAVIWNGGVMSDLGVPNGCDESSAAAISPSGHIAVAAWVDMGGTGSRGRGRLRAGRTGSGGYHAFIYADGRFTELPPLGDWDAYPQAINGADQVAGWSSLPNGARRASLWNGGKPVNLGTLGGENSSAFGINSSGVVGQSNTNTLNLSGDQDQHAFLSYKGVLTDLNDLIPSNSGWQLQSANGINDDGQIVGTGTRRVGNENRQRAFRLDPR
jgi:probable HAF family extracellular repeat protein